MNMANSVLKQDLIRSGGEPLKYLMERLETVFGKDRHWSEQELYTALAISAEPKCKEQVDLILRYRQSLGSKATTMFPHSTYRTLEKWHELIDRCVVMKVKGAVEPSDAAIRRKTESRMAILKARSTDPDTGTWLDNKFGVADREEYLKLKQEIL